MYAHDLANTRFNPNEHKITSATAHKLTKAWSKEGLKGVSGTPAVVGGVAYFGDWNGMLWAVKVIMRGSIEHQRTNEFYR